MANESIDLPTIREHVGHLEYSREIHLHVTQKGKYKIEQAMIDLAETIC